MSASRPVSSRISNVLMNCGSFIERKRFELSRTAKTAKPGAGFETKKAAMNAA
jgi:hypothetical protein